MLFRSVERETSVGGGPRETVVLPGPPLGQTQQPAHEPPYAAREGEDRFMFECVIERETETETERKREMGRETERETEKERERERERERGRDRERENDSVGDYLLLSLLLSPFLSFSRFYPVSTSILSHSCTMGLCVSKQHPSNGPLCVQAASIQWAGRLH